MTDQYHCQNCGTPMTATHSLWHQYCENCGLESSALYKTEFNGDDPIGWTDDAVDFLTQLRIDNAHTILKALSKHTQLDKLSAMDIGCAAGWFMQIANEYGIDVSGVEPDQNIAKVGQAKGFNINNCLFPDESLKNQSVDLITFNDVFEHIPDSGATLEAIHQQLNENGYLMLNLPNANGIFYRIAKLAAKFGYQTPLDRLWQKGYISPHLHYFNHTNLQQMCQQHGFKLLSKHKLPSIQIKGLWQRIRHNKAENIVTSALIYTGIVASYPLLRFVLPADIIFHIYQKQ